MLDKKLQTLFKKLIYESLYIWILALGLLSIPAEAFINLSLFRPVEEFATNNKELLIEGMVESTEVQLIAVSVNAPSGVSDLGALDASLGSLTVDLGSSRPLVSLAISPVFEEKLSLGPRVVNLSFSGDGKVFEDRGIFNCSSGMGQDNGLALAEFGVAINARYIRIDMLDGWQADMIRVREVAFFDTSGNLIEAKIRGLAINTHVNDDGIAYFSIKILLLEGENSISITARTLDLLDEVEEDSAIVNATYVSEVVVGEESLVLSDGYKAELVIPTDALTSKIKKLNIQSLNVGEIDWASYADNLLIAKGTSPMTAYNIEASAAIPFPVSAKASLERQPPELAVDGNPNYPSTWMTTVSPLPVWFKVDLREPRSVGKVTIMSRVQDKTSYGPKSVSIMVSDDDVNYTEAGRDDDCNDDKTEIPLPANPTTRYVQIVVEEGKQGNNVQINEIELRDSEGVKMESYVPLRSVMLARPVELTILYDIFDLNEAGIQKEENLALFGWNPDMQEWYLIGGKVDTDNNWVVVNLNHLSTFAIFEAVPPLGEVRWSYNPFSPNGDGIADTTTMSISMNKSPNGQAKVEIYDRSSKLIRTLIYEEGISGYISISWDGKDENGRLVGIGPYLYQVTVDKEVRNGVLIVTK